MVYDVFWVLGVMLRMLLYILEAVEGGLRLLEVLEWCPMCWSSVPATVICAPCARSREVRAVCAVGVVTFCVLFAYGL